MENTQEEYIFKNSFVFVETGNLKNDLYRAMKDEVGYMCEKKHAQYTKDFYEMNQDNEYYYEFSELLNKLKGILLDPHITTLKEFQEQYKFEVKLGLAKEDDEKMLIVLNCIRQFDEIIDEFAYDILTEVKNNNYQTKYGAFYLINFYLKNSKNKKYKNFQEFLDTIYSVIYNIISLKYGDKYGKKI